MTTQTEKTGAGHSTAANVLIKVAAVMVAVHSVLGVGVIGAGKPPQ